MGIPSYFSYIIKNYSNIIRKLNQITGLFSHLYMDCNSIIYDAYHKLAASDEPIIDIESAILASVCVKISEYIQLIKPTNTVFIAFDGVAPFAKMEQQRTRRYKSWKQGQIDDNQAPWNTSAITPGTKFMDRLSKHIAREFNDKESQYGVRQIIVSSSDVPGEGEHKMFQHIRDFAEETDTIAVYGLDSDLIMLSIFHTYLCNNIYIFREAPEFMGSIASQELKASISMTDPLFMDIELLSGSIMTEMQCKYPDNQRIYDYAFLCFFLGNDFLPHFPALNIRTSGIQTLLDTYRLFIGSHNDRFFIAKDTGTIQWRWVQLFVNELAKMEHELLIQEYGVRDKWSRRQWPETTEEDRKQLVLNVPVIQRAVEHYICPKEKYWEERYYRSICGLEKTSDNIKAICTNYIEGLEWTFKYYTVGCPNNDQDILPGAAHWRWKYHYNYPPLLSDLCRYVPHFKMAFIDPTTESNCPFVPHVQLAYVIPMANHEALLGKAISRNLKSKYAEYYPSQWTYQWAFCRYFWEAHIILPDIPVETLDKWTAELLE